MKYSHTCMHKIYPSVCNMWIMQHTYVMCEYTHTNTGEQFYPSLMMHVLRKDSPYTNPVSKDFCTLFIMNDVYKVKNVHFYVHWNKFKPNLSQLIWSITGVVFRHTNTSGLFCFLLIEFSLDDLFPLIFPFELDNCLSFIT